MNKIIFSLVFIIPVIYNKIQQRDDSRYMIQANSIRFKNKIEEYMSITGKQKLSNLYFSIHVVIYLIYNSLFLEKYETELVELEYNKESFHLEFIKNNAYYEKNYDKIVCYSPGLVETKIDPIISNTIKYYSSEGYNFCIFWKCGIKKLEENFHLMGNPEHYKQCITQLEKRGYKNIFLSGISAGSYNIFKYITSDHIHSNIRAASIICGTLELDNNLNEMPQIWKNYFSRKLKNRANKSLNCPIFSKNDDLLTIINKISATTDVNLKENSDKEKRILTNINIPCLFLNAEDDPVIKIFNNEPYPLLESPNFIRVVTKLGGHGSYVKFEKWKFNFCLFSTNISNHFFESFIIND
jgi:predicted alpha/beta-fold hydrolase